MSCHFDHPHDRTPDINPDIVTDNTITADNIIKQFEEDVIKVILDGAYHSKNIPTYTYSGNGITYQCVPSSMLGTNQYLEPENNIWNELAISGDIVTALINITSMFTNVGTFTWTLYEETSGYPEDSGVTNGTKQVATKSGKCIFNKDKYSRTLASLSDDGDVSTNTEVNANGLLRLIRSCLNAWKNTNKESYSASVTISNTCHSNCHSDCHDNCDTCHSECYTDCHNDCHNDCHTDCHIVVVCHSVCYDKNCYEQCHTSCHSDCNHCYDCYSGMNR